MQQPPEWYGGIKGDIGRLEGKVDGLSYSVNRSIVRLETHMDMHRPTSAGTGEGSGPDESRNVREIAVKTGIYGGIAAAVYAIMDLVKLLL